MGAIALPFLFSLPFTTFFLNLIYYETHIECEDGNMMIYRDHREYDKPPMSHKDDILKSWLRGESDINSLRTWLSSISY